VTSNLPFKSMKKQLCRFFCERVLSQWLNPLRALIFHIFHGARHGSQINLSTGTAPLTAIQGQSWQEMVDHRGETVYSTEDASPVSITRPGPYPDNTTTLTPDVPYPVWNGEGWITDTAAQNAANIQENIRIYRELMMSVVLAQCPLTSAVSLGETLTDAQKNTLAGLQEYATELAEFIQNADLTITNISFPTVNPGLLEYPFN
ncbi:tail fiber assembly protein, partial [Salmonella enterica]|nr:tail fiber assembly protein [Salmonella enterica]EKA6667991.1 tail fiber assembly protein [Salmonella enterica]